MNIIVNILGYEIEHEAVLDKNDYNKTAERIINTLADSKLDY